MKKSKDDARLREGLSKLLSGDPKDERAVASVMQQLQKFQSKTSSNTREKNVTRKCKRKRERSAHGTFSDDESRTESESGESEGTQTDRSKSFVDSDEPSTPKDTPKASQLSPQPNVLSEQSRSQQSVEVNKVFKESKNQLSDAAIQKILNQAQEGRLNNFIMDRAPVKPKGGQIFLCRSKGHRDFSYRTDEYFGLKIRGDNSTSKTSPLFRWYLKYLDEDGNVVPGFEKDEYCLRQHVKDANRIILVHYIGSESVWTPRPHGNSKKGKIFTPNRKDVRESAKHELSRTEKMPKKTYHNMINAASKDKDFPYCEATITPRDIKQVQNVKYQLDQEKKILRDELFSVYEMIRSRRLGGFLKMFMVPDEAFVLAEPEALRFASYLLKEARDVSKKLPQVLTYDTTFCVVDGYVSPLVMRNTCIKSDPLFAVAFLFHERKTTASHDVFWREMIENLLQDGLPPLVPICTDREKAITTAIQRRLGEDVNLVYCNNHIKRDAKFWLQKCQGKKPADVIILPKEVDTILQSATAEDFDINYEHFEKTWSKPFREYMSANLRDDMKQHAAHFFTSTFPAFESYDATNNAAESLNASVKREVDWKTLRIDSAMLILFNMQQNYLKEFARAYASTGIGDYVLKPYYQNSKMPFTVPAYAHWDHQAFVDLFKDGLYKPSQNVEKEGKFLQARSAIAKLACSMQYVSLNSQTLTFTVTDPYSGSRNAVEEHNQRLTCTCPDSGVCFHKIAYLHVTKKEIIEDKCSWSLSELRKKTRNFKGRSGKKHLDREDFDDIIEAPDSQLAKEKEEMTEFMPSDDSVEHEKSVFVSQRKVRTKETYKIPREDDELTHSCPKKLDSIPTSIQMDDLDIVLENHICQDEGLLSISSDGMTPEEFSLNGFKEVDNKKILKSPTYRCLQPGEMIMTDIVDDMVALLIKIHGLSGRVGFVNSYISSKAEQAICTDSIEMLLRCTLRISGLNNDVVLVNIRPANLQHYILGVIMFQIREIIVINSCESCPSDPSDVFSMLWRLTASFYISAGFEFDPLGWRLYTESDCAQQSNSFDCGLHVIYNAYAVVRKQAFCKSEHFPRSDLLRAWTLACLTNKQVQRPIALVTKSGRSRLPVILKRAMLDDMNNYLSCNSVIESRSCYMSIRNQVREVRFSDGKCQSLTCTVDDDGSGKTILCVVCRMWRHLGTCVPQSAVQSTFFCCPGCEKYKLHS